MPKKEKKKILFVSAEVSPFAKTGGLADVSGSLPRVLSAMGNDVRVVMPGYKSISAEKKYIADFPVWMDSKTEECIVREGGMDYKSDNKTGKVPVYFVDNYNYFYRDGIYCFYDDGERFAFFCKAVLEMLPQIGFQPDVIHCNDWHTGPICMLLKEKYAKTSFYENISTIYTIHNLQYQGLFSGDLLRLFEVGGEVFTPEKVEFYGSFNFMKAGLVYADIINTVSETYAKEIQTPEYGEKLEGLLEKRSVDLYGIVNGIDYEEFNPEKDARIVKNFNADTLSDKKANKYALQQELGLPQRDVPVMGIVSRLTGQKGLNLVVEILDKILERDVQFVLLGSGDENYESYFKNLKVRYPEKAGVYIGFNAVLAQKIYAGCDIFLMPSLFEPCGLGQLISLRYGTIPVVRATGGLAETVTDIDAHPEEGNGFSFREFSSAELSKAVERALNMYEAKPEKWEQMVVRAMKQDYSWKKSAEKYVELYKKATLQGHYS